jgi:hypothetical protein
MKPSPSPPVVLLLVGKLPLLNTSFTAACVLNDPVPTWPPTLPEFDLIASEVPRFLATDRCISAKRTFSITCCVPPTVIRFDTRSGA